MDTLMTDMKALDIKYDPQYVDMILQGDKDKIAGKGKTITTDELDALFR
jgi:hypothetical protein